jgi:hypothetical protein
MLHKYPYNQCDIVRFAKCYTSVLTNSVILLGLPNVAQVSLQTVRVCKDTCVTFGKPNNIALFVRILVQHLADLTISRCLVSLQTA